MASIPSDFYPSDSEGPFDSCKMCSIDLMDPPRHYIIEKAYRQYPGTGARELIYEIAICHTCLEESRQAMSDESIERIKAFTSQFEEHHQFSEHPPHTPDDCCLFTGKPKQEMDEYKMIGIFYGRSLFPGTSSYLISGEIMHQFSELLSAKTRDEMDRFKQQILDTPPELKELFDDYDLVFI